MHHLVYLERTSRGTIEERRRPVSGVPLGSPRVPALLADDQARGTGTEGALEEVHRRIASTREMTRLLEAIGRRLVARACDDQYDADGLPIITTSVAAILGGLDPEGNLELPDWLDAGEEDDLPLELSGLVDRLDHARTDAVRRDAFLLMALRRLADDPTRPYERAVGRFNVDASTSGPTPLGRIDR